MNIIKTKSSATLKLNNYDIKQLIYCLELAEAYIDSYNMKKGSKFIEKIKNELKNG